ncbi:MAG: flagellar hook protein FlgE [Syntrophomonadaceae bacterium]|nr:flagellar hook protein FlgE [Syntrophomonadaceae bacterium]
MMRSMYSAISGLKNHQTKMDVIGNNIANVNTYGFKKGRVVFKDALYQTMKTGSAPQDNRGGTNSMSIGLGMSLGSIDTINTPGSSQSTGKNTDLCISGNGYFIVQSGHEMLYTRSGAFDFDETGNFYALGNGALVLGWMADPNNNWNINTDDKGNPVPINIGGLSSLAPQASTAMNFTGNLDSSSADSAIVPTSKVVYDSLGNEHTIYFQFTKTAVPNEWECRISAEPDFSTSIVTGTDPIPMEFDTSGRLVSPTGVDVELSGISGAEDIDIDIDFSSITQYKGESTAWASYCDGYTSGDLRSISIDETGTIKGTFSNGQIRDLGMVALATFQNPAGLTNMGGSLFQVSSNSGDPNIGLPGNEDRGVLIPSNLEMSNVDLSEEFVDMITTQRGFQANSRVITTSDQMLEELVNLKR